LRLVTINVIATGDILLKSGPGLPEAAPGLASVEVVPLNLLTWCAGLSSISGLGELVM
jgi:hypothetical protein